MKETTKRGVEDKKKRRKKLKKKDYKELLVCVGHQKKIQKNNSIEFIRIVLIRALGPHLHLLVLILILQLVKPVF